MKIAEKYLPKFKSNSISIPSISIQSKGELLKHIQKNQPFIMSFDLGHYLEIVKNQIELMDKNFQIKTFDSIPYSEIREGIFSDYLDYALNDSIDKFYPDNFELTEIREGKGYLNKFRHYALSLNHDVFPKISNFKVPYLGDDNYLLQLRHEFYTKFNITSPHWLFIHPKFSVSNAHYDHDCVHTFIFQLEGTKKAFLISPDQHAFIRNNNFPLQPNGFNDFTHDLLEHLPSAGLNLWEGEIDSNQIIYIPKKWVHFVVGKTPGLSYSQDVVLKDNFCEWTESIMEKLNV
jgi:hypothetical protein